MSVGLQYQTMQAGTVDAGQAASASQFQGFDAVGCRCCCAVPVTLLCAMSDMRIHLHQSVLLAADPLSVASQWPASQPTDGARPFATSGTAFQAPPKTRRSLTKPDAPHGNSGWDNENSDLIIHVDDELSSADGARHAA